MNGQAKKRRGIQASARGPASGVAQERIHPTSQRLRTVLDATTEGYGCWNVSSGEMRFGNRWLAAMGYSSSNLSKNPGFVMSLMHPDDCAGFQAQLETHLAGKTPMLHCELRFRAKTGLYRWFELRAKVVRGATRRGPIELAGTVCDIQARKKKQQEMAASVEQLTAIFQAAEDVVFVVDPGKFRLLSFNKAFEDLLLKARGIKARLGMRPEDITPERAETWNKFYRYVLEHGKASRDYQLHSINMTLHLVAQSLVRNGRAHGICIFGRDMTDRKQMEEALRRSEERFSRAFREGPLGLALTSVRDNRYIEVNDAFMELTGYSREELIGKNPSEVGLWARPEQRTELIQKLMPTGEVRNFDTQYRTKSGELREILASAVLIDMEGDPCMLHVSHDVTEQRRAIEALRASEERLRLAIESGHMYAFEWDPATDLVRRSRESAAILHLAGDASKHTQQEFIEMVHPDDKEHYVEALNFVTPENPSYKTVFRVLRRGEHMLWLEESGRAFFEEGGKIEKVVGMTHDVTEIRESERALRELSGRLISTQEEERRRIARELHDHIGQELALLCVQAHRVASGKSDQGETTRTEAHELYNKTKEIATAVSKLSHRLHSSELDCLGLSVAAERLCRDFEHQSGIVVDCEMKNVPQKLDKEKALCLYRVLQEALQNVAKHSGAKRAEVELEARKNQLILRVNDNGVGFDLDLARFDSGLGLISIRERLNLVGGRLKLTSKVGSGTTLAASVLIKEIPEGDLAARSFSTVG